ncbi:MAG: M48 family metallopeptidase [Bacteroidetes bacterium]|jgi:predicted metal-dependent hydrolase|nr:M48 family metallopeptidase [Bacteroidota bacterium]
MKQAITLAGQPLSCVVKKSKGGRIRLSFDEAGSLVVHTPTGRLDEAMPFLQEKARWVLRHAGRQQQAQAAARQYQAQLHQQASLLGTTRQIQLLDAPSPRYRLAGPVLQVWAPAHYHAQPKPLLRYALRRLADNYLKQRTQELAAHTGNQPNQIRVKSHSSKWGSCSSKRNLNLNWHLILFDKMVIDYVILHELMHLREMNHSPRFWAHVAHYMPHYKAAIRILQAETWKIGIYD